MTIGKYRFSHTHIVRFWVIVSLVISCIFITSLAFSRQFETIIPQIFYFSILYATYFFRKRGILIAGICALAYQTIAYYYLFPDTVGLGYSTVQAILFICVAVVVAYFLDEMETVEARYSRIFGDSQLGIVLFDRNKFAITFANRQMENMLGYTEKELGSMTFAQLFQNNDGRRLFFERVGSGEDITDFETCFTTKQGTPFWVSLSWSRESNFISCLVMDINTRKSEEMVTDDTYNQYKQITEISPLGIIIVQNNRITYANPAFRAFSEYNSDYLTDRELISIIHRDDRDKFLDFAKRLQKKIPFPEMAEFRFLSQSGETKPAALFFAPIEQKEKPALLIHLVTIIKVDYSVFSISNLLTTIIEAGDYSLKADIQIQVPPNITFESDVKKISFVIDSFLSNAVNHSKTPKKVWITYNSAQHDTFHHLAIKDNGNGFTDAQLDVIFNPVQPGDSKILNPVSEHIGLFLPLARKFVQMHGGSVSIESIVNLGSTFTINIPKQRIK